MMRSRWRGEGLSAPAVGALVGVAVGLIDCGFLLFSRHARITPLLPAGTFFSVLWFWCALLAAIGFVFQLIGLRRLALPAMVVVGPGIVLLSRVGEELKTWTGLSTAKFILGFGVIVAVAAVLLARDRFAPIRAKGMWASAILLSLVWLGFSALNMPWRDLLPHAARRGPGNRNVVLIFLDTVRRDDSVDPTTGVMSGLKQFGSSSLQFDQAWSSGPWTIPVHFAILTGKDPWRIPFNRTEKRYATRPVSLVRRFQKAGYATSAILANALLTKTEFGEGFDEHSVSLGTGVCRTALADLLGRLVLHDLPNSPVCGMYVASQITARATRFVNRIDRPYFLMLNYFDAHEPYYVEPQCVPAAKVPKFRSVRVEFNAAKADSSPVVMATVHDRYRDALRCMDHELSKLLATLQAQPDAATTTILIVGDHGEQFGEHGLIGHGNSVYPELLRVPLIARGPGLPQGRVSQPVTTTDLHALMLQVLAPARTTPIPRLLDPNGRRPAHAYYSAVDPPPSAGFTIIDGDDQYIRFHDGREEILDAHTGVERTGVRAVDPAARAVAIREMNFVMRSNPFDGLGYLQ